MLSKSEIHFLSRNWDGPFYRPNKCGDEWDRKMRPPHVLCLDAIGAEGAWIYPLAGYSYYEVNGQKHLVQPGTVLALLKPCQGKFIRVSEGLPFHYIWINLIGEQALSFFGFIHEKFGTVQRLPAGCEAVRKAHGLIRLATQRQRRTAHFWSLKTFEWLNAWWECAERYNSPLPTFQKLVDRPSRSLPATLGTIKNFARQMGYSRSYISHKLRQQWKEPPGRVLRRIRLEEGARLLRSSRMAVAVIASKVGFSENSSFTRAFKPRDYREKHR
jgi:AraC-like DNA-binding protein